MIRPISVDWFGQVMVSGKLFGPTLIAKAYEGFCPLCPDERFYISDEPPGSAADIALREASVGEEWDDVLLSCHCCQGMYDLQRGEARINQGTFGAYGNWLDGYVEAPCAHIRDFVDEAVRRSHDEARR